MKKIQVTDSLRNIKKQLVSWLSIIVIASFATAAYLGLTYSAYGLKQTGESLYNSTNFRDIQVSSNCLLSESDLSEISELEGITHVEGRLRTFAKLKLDDRTESITVSSLPETIGVPIIKSGRLPSKPDECIIEKTLSDKLSLNIGDTLTLKDSYGEDIPELYLNSFHITGIFLHSDHISTDLNESYCLHILPSAFDLSKLDYCYSYADITFDKSGIASTFDDKYFEVADHYVDIIEELGKQLNASRYEAYTKFMSDSLLDSEKELSDASDELELASRMIPSLKSKTGETMADLGNMLSVIISKDPVTYKTAEEQITDYDEALIEYDHAIKRVDDTKESYNKTLAQGEALWYVFNRNSNPSFVYLKNNIENLRNLNLSFSSLFIVISIMVIFVSLSRMVYEQRSIIGISKALGMHENEIFSKYFIFGFSAALIGIIMGIIFSVFILEWVIALGFGDHFIFGQFPFVIELTPTIATIVIASLVALASIYFSCSSLLKETAKKLLSPKIPKGHMKALEKSFFLKKLPLFSRIIILNIRSDFVRVIVTVLSVAGCCALTVIGFSIRSSIGGALDRQISDYTGYDAKISINTSVSDDVAKNISALLVDYNVKFLLFLDKQGSVQMDDTIEYMEFLISDDLAALSYYHPLLDWHTGKNILSEDNTQKNMKPEDGIIITTKLAEIYNLSPGDDIYILDGMGYKHSAIISGIIQNYIGRYVVCTKKYYEKIVDTHYNDNTFFITMNDKSKEESLIQSLSDISGFEVYEPATEQVASLQSVVIVLNLIVGLLIIISAVMALFVILGLANMYIVSKKTELTVMRINGYTVKETIIYAIREVIFTTATGIILGIYLGCNITFYVLHTMEQVHIMFVKEPSMPSCFISVLITVLFTGAIYAIAMSKVKNLSLKDI
ncbi:ABC transporter permease [Butyrivibrio sp. AE3004]|uniref:ABC transporter permease n=1 Tax=Butyrivibrio sp. AE3004 TaxID=1506994 RepID=UPI000494431C|nr:ABC transporter permease [Butyrivibrio sp. AE3004]